MNTRKITGGFAAVLPIVMLSSLATAADDGAISMVASEIVTHAGNLACNIDTSVDPASISWVDHEGNTQTAPIWQHKGKVGTFGCTVHDNLVKQLFVPHDEPPLTKGKGKGFRLAQGAANSFMDGKFDDGVKHICTFIDVIENSARLNTVDDFAPTSAYALAMGQLATAKGWLYDLDVDPTACYEILGY